MDTVGSLSVLTESMTGRIPRRFFSDRLLGHSPMAPGTVAPGTLGASIPTAADVTTSGGVWAPTSAKREKLRELKADLMSENMDQNAELTLDDVATDDQKLDLFLVDGLDLLVQTTDTAVAGPDNAVLQQARDWFTAQSVSGPLTQIQLEEYLTDAGKQLESLLSTLPSDRCLRDLRDMYIPPSEEMESQAAALVESSTATGLQANAQDALARFRLLLAWAASEHLKASWKTLTTISDQDVDRAAVKGESIDPEATKTLSAEKVNAVLLSFLEGNCSDRVDALWVLVDRDQDGRIDEVEMNIVCELAVEPVRKALDRLFEEALQAYPVRAPILPVIPEESDNGNDGAKQMQIANNPKPGWRQRRREAKQKRILTKMFRRTLKAHFLDEVEMPHRLRCIYAWANKEHQDNKIDSVLVDEVGWTGRKRYVELHPKIRLEEFREVQQEHFTHLDRVGTEFIKSFREELWIAQGKGRNRKQLIRDCALFMVVVCLIDYGIVAL